MEELRAGLFWLTAGVVGMASLLVVVLFGLAIGLLALLVASAPMLAGAGLRSQAVAISGLLSGFGVLWLFFAAGEFLRGVDPGTAVGGYPGLFAIGGFVVLIGATLAVWRMTRQPAT